MWLLGRMAAQGHSYEGSTKRDVNWIDHFKAKKQIWRVAACINTYIHTRNNYPRSIKQFIREQVFFKHLLLQDKIKMVFQRLALLYLLRNVTLDNYFWNRTSLNTNQKSLPKMRGWDYVWLSEDGEESISSPHTHSIQCWRPHNLFWCQCWNSQWKVLHVLVYSLVFKTKGDFYPCVSKKPWLEQFFWGKKENERYQNRWAI